MGRLAVILAVLSLLVASLAFGRALTWQTPPRTAAAGGEETAAPEAAAAEVTPDRASLPEFVRQELEASCREHAVAAAIVAADVYRESASGPKAVQGRVYREVAALQALAEELYIARCLAWLTR